MTLRRRNAGRIERLRGAARRARFRVTWLLGRGRGARRADPPSPVLFGVLAVLRLVYVPWQFVTQDDSAGLDSWWYLTIARYLGAGDWLGPYRDVTLARPPGFPIFIALCGRIGVPYTLGVQLVHVAAAYVFVRAIAPLVHRRLLVFIYLFVLWSPVGTMEVNYLMMREALDTPLSLLTLACALGAFARRDARPGRFGAWIAGVGAGLACLVLVREEHVLLYPSFALLAAGLAWSLRGHWPRRIVVARVALSLLVPAATVAAARAAVCEINRRTYGVFAVTLLDTEEFRAAYGAIVRAASPDAHPYLAIDGVSRQRAYAASPRFEELRTHLEDDGALAACPGPSCRHHGNFRWSLLTVPAARGHHASARRALEYYRALAAELDDACERGVLQCTPNRGSLVPDASLLELFRAAGEMPSFAVRTFLPEWENHVASRSRVHVERRPDVEDASLNLLSPPENRNPRGEGCVRLYGWAHNRRPHRVSLSLQSQGMPADGSSIVVIEPEHEVEELIFGNCPAPCRLVAHGNGQLLGEAAVLPTTDRIDADLGGVRVIIDPVQYCAPGDLGRRWQLEEQVYRRGARLARLAWVYHEVTVPALLAVLLLFALRLAQDRRARRVPHRAIVTVALLLPVLARIAVVTYLHVTMWQMDEPRFLTPALAFIHPMLAFGLAALAPSYHPRRRVLSRAP